MAFLRVTRCPLWLSFLPIDGSAFSLNPQGFMRATLDLNLNANFRSTRIRSLRSRRIPHLGNQ